MKKILLFALALCAAAALSAQTPNPTEARNQIFEMLWEAEDSEILDLYRGFVEIENDPELRAAIAAILGMNETDLGAC